MCSLPWNICPLYVWSFSVINGEPVREPPQAPLIGKTDLFFLDFYFLEYFFCMKRTKKKEKTTTLFSSVSGLKVVKPGLWYLPLCFPGVCISDPNMNTAGVWQEYRWRDEPAFLCASLVKSKPTGLCPQELKLDAEKYFCIIQISVSPFLPSPSLPPHRYPPPPPHPTPLTLSRSPTPPSPPFFFFYFFSFFFELMHGSHKISVEEGNYEGESLYRYWKTNQVKPTDINFFKCKKQIHVFHIDTNLYLCFVSPLSNLCYNELFLFFWLSPMTAVFTVTVYCFVFLFQVCVRWTFTLLLS